MTLGLARAAADCGTLVYCFEEHMPLPASRGGGLILTIFILTICILVISDNYGFPYSGEEGEDVLLEKSCGLKCSETTLRLPFFRPC